MAKTRLCPECGAEMDAGRVEMKLDTGSWLVADLTHSLVECWFVSAKDWLVIPSGHQKEAFRCVHCGTTIILRGR